ncbi:MAG: FAD:protein FMN transferase [Cyclobacteriaceae bacterium]
MNRWITLFSLIIGLVSCEPKKEQPYIQFYGSTMGTSYSVKYADDQQRDFQKEVDSLLEVYNRSVSTYIPDAEISSFNQSNNLEDPSDYFLTVLNESFRIHQLTGGAFDPTVMPLVNAWGFGYSKPSTIPTEQAVASLLEIVGMDKIKLAQSVVEKENPRTQLDFSAIAKGYGSDLVADFLVSKGITSLMVEIGGEVVCRGEKTNGKRWTIGIEDPTKTRRSLHQALSLKDQAMATSGNYRNFKLIDGKKYAHTISPKTGFPVDHHLLSASIVSNSCMTADALATACMVKGVEGAMKLVESIDGTEGYFIYEDERGAMQAVSTEGVKELLVKNKK